MEQKLNEFATGKNGRLLLISGIYALLTIVMTWPVAAQLGTHIPGKIGDAYIHLWVFEWLKETLGNGQSPFYTMRIFYPVGVSLLNHNIAWVNFLFWLPLQALLGAEAGYSVAFLLIFPLNGAAVYLFMREIGGETAAFVSGLIAAFWPYNLSHHGHPNLILIAWVPLTMLFLHRTWRSHRWTNAGLAGFFLAMIGLTRWQLLIIAAPLLGLYLLWLLMYTPRTQIAPFLQRLLLSGGVALLLIAPLFVPLLTYQLHRSNPEELLVEESPYPADLVAYVTPGSYHPLWGDAVRPLTRGFVGNNIYVRFIGYTVLLLALAGAAARRRQARFWLLAAGIYLLLALGPDLHIAGTAVLPLPYRLIEDSFIIQNLRFPDRFNVLLGLPVSLLAGFGIAAVQERRPFRRQPQFVVALLSLLILFEYSNRYETLSLHTPAWYGEIAAVENDFAILDIPAYSEEQFNKQYMRYQLVHNKPLVVGRVARPPQQAFTFIQSTPLLQHLLSNKTPPTEIANPSQQLRQLAAAGVRYLVLHRQFLSDAEQQAWQDWFVQPPVHADEDVIVYHSTPVAIGRDVPFQTTVVPNRLALIAVVMTPDVTQGGWLRLDATWGGLQPVDSDLGVCLTLTAVQPEADQRFCQPVSTQWPTSRWQANEIVHAGYAFQIDPFAPAGRYESELTLIDADRTAVGTAVSLGPVTIHPLDRQFTPPTPQTPLDATWSAGIALVGYNLAITAEQLSLTLHWSTQQRIDKSYKFFVHLIDVQQGTLAAQADFVPKNWTYPTNWWATGEYVTDTVDLLLADAPPGVYELRIGIYDPDDNRRLSVSQPNGASANALLLTTIER